MRMTARTQVMLILALTMLPEMLLEEQQQQ